MRIGSPNVCCDYCSKESSYNTCQTRDSVPEMYVVIVAQKNHHTKPSPQGATDVIPRGTIIDNRVCHPKRNGFYLCAQSMSVSKKNNDQYLSNVCFNMRGLSS